MICLMIGLMIGGLFGVSVMCLLQINRINKMNCKYKMEVSDDEKSN